jgi:hypothetical protein
MAGAVQGGGTPSVKREEAEAEAGVNADLLMDVWRVFYASGQGALHTKDLCRRLNEMEEASWASAKRGKPIDGHYLHINLAGFLPEKPETIAPRKFSTRGMEAHGYSELHFEDAFIRYLGKALPSAQRKADAVAQRVNPPVDPVEPSTQSKHDARSRTSQATGGNRPSVDPVDKGVESTGTSTGKSTASTSAHKSPVDENNKRAQRDNGRIDATTGSTGTFNPVARAHTPDEGAPSSNARPNGPDRGSSEPPAIPPTYSPDDPPPSGGRGRKPRTPRAPDHKGVSS